MAFKDKSRQREYQRQRVAARREKYISLFGGKCSLCTSVEGLEFDHKDRSEKLDHRIWSWSEIRLEAELAKCQLMCRSCHMEKSIAEMGYPERQHGTNLKYMKDKCRCVLCKAAHAVTNRIYR